MVYLQKEFYDNLQSESNKGSGLKNEEQENLPDLLEIKCPCFECMRKILDERANFRDFDVYENGTHQIYSSVDSLHFNEIDDYQYCSPCSTSAIEMGDPGEDDSEYGLNHITSTYSRSDHVIWMSSSSPINTHKRKRGFQETSDSIFPEPVKVSKMIKIILDSINNVVHSQDLLLLKHLEYQREEDKNDE
ncbi:hypothetical protein O181_005695 [Austropuccinia psidii MF-1]|uniref:Uncharacterized protein n=1 Tax=Austropuccinia psidii MF-1 TaxID=1389203 RepID=A0A9Q3BIV9_9BASI|nr:hypothetical protein [Austropuccinia psidii MF-1]